MDSPHSDSMEVTPALITLAFEGYPIRCFDTGDVMEWVAADVCAAVQLSGSAKTQALERLSPDEKLTRTAKVLGRKQRFVVVTEAGLLSLLCLSEITQATRFKRWLAREVIQAVNAGEMEAQQAALSRQIQQLKQKLELAQLTAHSAQTALKDAIERLKWSERMNELHTRSLDQQRQTIAELESQLASSQQELKQCQKIIVQTAQVLGVKAMDILHQSEEENPHNG